MCLARAKERRTPRGAAAVYVPPSRRSKATAPTEVASACSVKPQKSAACSSLSASECLEAGSSPCASSEQVDESCTSDASSTSSSKPKKLPSSPRSKRRKNGHSSKKGLAKESTPKSEPLTGKGFPSGQACQEAERSLHASSVQADESCTSDASTASSSKPKKSPSAQRSKRRKSDQSPEKCSTEESEPVPDALTSEESPKLFEMHVDDPRDCTSTESSVSTVPSASSHAIERSKDSDSAEVEEDQMDGKPVIQDSSRETRPDQVLSKSDGSAACGDSSSHAVRTVSQESSPPKSPTKRTPAQVYQPPTRRRASASAEAGPDSSTPEPLAIGNDVSHPCPGMHPVHLSRVPCLITVILEICVNSKSFINFVNIKNVAPGDKNLIAATNRHNFPRAPLVEHKRFSSQIISTPIIVNF